MQIDNETYLRPHEAVALVRQLRGCSTGWATGLVQRAVTSGNVRTHEGAVQNFRRRAGEQPARKITLVNKVDLFYWLYQEVPPGSLLPQPSSPETSRARTEVEEKRRIATEKQLREFVRSGLADKLSLDEIERRAKDGELVMSRARVRAEYHKQEEDIRRGRPRKNNSPK